MKICELFDFEVPAEFAQIEISHLCDDSRRAAPGSLFVARSGSTVDGAKFIAAAKSAGASLTLGELGSGADLEIQDLKTQLPEILERFYGFPSQGLTLNAVTGTNGKTTTAFLLQHALQNWSSASALTGTVCQVLGTEVRESQLTTPGLFDFYLLMSELKSKNLRYLNFEASSHALDQGRIGHLKVKTAIFTNLSQDHLDYHHTMDEYFAAKQKLFREHLSIDGKAIVNLDNAWGAKLATEGGFNLWTTSCSGQKADFNLDDLSTDPLRPHYRIYGQGLDIEVHTLLPGDFNRENLIGAVAALYFLGVDGTSIQNSVATMTVPGRMEKIKHPTRHVFVDYAHTPDALQRVTASLKPLTQGRLITLFGCGGDRDRTKRPLMAEAAEQGSDFVILTSDNPRTEDPQQILSDVQKGLKLPEQSLIISDRKEAIERAVRMMTDKDVLLIAGKGHEDYQIIGTTKHPFDDRLIAAQALETLV